MHSINRVDLKRPKKLASRHKLIGVVKLNLQFTLCRPVNIVNDRLCYMLSQSSTCIGLKPPFNSLLGMNCMSGKTPAPTIADPFKKVLLSIFVS